jgi:hypothetical protein
MTQVTLLRNEPSAGCHASGSHRGSRRWFPALPCPATRTRLGHLLLAGLIWSSALLLNHVAWAQYPPIHYFHSSDLPPGTVGRGQLERGGPLRGYFQPVEVRVPDGVLLSVAQAGQFEEAAGSSIAAGMLIGEVYRFRVANISFFEGLEVYPTIEVINRLYPPPGLERKFPIPVQITQEELELALNGNFVTRVIYLENPETALPQAQDPDLQPYYQVRSDEDPLLVADRLGRPMAILRMGSRVPDRDPQSGRFTFGAPPLIKFPPAVEPIPTSPDKSPVEREARDYPRTPLPAPQFAPQVAPQFAPQVAPQFAPQMAPQFAPQMAPQYAPQTVYPGQPRTQTPWLR